MFCFDLCLFFFVKQINIDNIVLYINYSFELLYKINVKFAIVVFRGKLHSLGRDTC